MWWSQIQGVSYRDCSPSAKLYLLSWPIVSTQWLQWCPHCGEVWQMPGRIMDCILGRSTIVDVLRFSTLEVEIIFPLHQL